MIHSPNNKSQEAPEMTDEEALATIRRCAAPYIIYGEDDPRNLYTIWEEPAAPSETEVQNG